VALNYSVREVKDVSIIDLVGHMTMTDAVAIGPEGSGFLLSDIVRNLAEKSKKKILVNLADISYVDSTGVGALVRALATARSHGADLKLLSPVSSVFGLLRVTKLDKVFDVKDDEAAAVAASFATPAAGR
jgi:anti-sigma B factor antagonist